MPLFEYRCSCGKQLEVLVRGGREPETCGEAGEPCPNEGSLKRLISTISVGSSNTQSMGGSEEPMCGSCGKVPGSCQLDN